MLTRYFVPGFCLVTLAAAAEASHRPGQDNGQTIWCDTDAGILGLAGNCDGCPSPCDCDSPETRDDYIPGAGTPVKIIRLHFIVLREDDGSNPAASVEDITLQVSKLNDNFEPWALQLVHSYEFVDSSVHRVLENDADVAQMKDELAFETDQRCNVYVTGLRGDLPNGGRGYFPWWSDPLGVAGGIIINEGAFQPNDQVLTHEVGHNLGLFHTHHGVTEVGECSACWEAADGENGDTTGDFCSDTPPTPLSYSCSPPGGTDDCSDTPWGDTQPENYMSYGGLACWSLFTEQQAGRMHCWTESVLSGWYLPLPCEPWAETDLLVPPGTAPADQVGGRVSVNNGILFTGAKYHDEIGADAGAVYVSRLKGSTWTLEQELLASDGAAGDHFGESLECNGAAGIVGASFHDAAGSNSGAAYVFLYDGFTWNETKLLPNDGEADDRFGVAVSMSGTVAVVGAAWDDDNGLSSGSVYVFRRDFGDTNWTFEQKLLAYDGAPGDLFGSAVAVATDRIVVGSPWDDDNGSDSGSAYVFRFNNVTWELEQKILPTSAGPGHQFGCAVNMSGSGWAIIGASASDVQGTESGAAYVFRRTGAIWTQDQLLLPEGIGPGDRFGNSVSISGHYNGLLAVVGSSGADAYGSDSGAAYVFIRNNSFWSEQQRLLASDGMTGDGFGWSVTVHFDEMAIGAVGNDDNGADSGSVYTFFGPEFPDCNDNAVPDSCDIEEGEPDCNGNDVPDVCDIADGDSLDLNANGIPDECEVVGACCLADESCIVTDDDSCGASGGTFLGAGTTCLGTPCTSEPTESLREHYNTGDDGVVYAELNRWVGQTFTAGEDYELTMVRAKIYRQDQPGNIRFQVYEVDSGGLPTGIPIDFTPEFDGNSLGGPDGVFVAMGFVEQAGLRAGNEYALVLSGSVTGASNDVLWRSDTTNPTYEDGHVVIREGGVWTIDESQDLMFEIYTSPREYYISGDDGVVYAELNRWVGQTFTAGEDYELTMVRAKIYRQDQPGNIRFQVYEVDSGGLPTGIPIDFTPEFDGNSLGGPDGVFVAMGFVEQAGLRAGNEYALVLSGSVTGASNDVLWRSDTTNPTYEDGHVVIREGDVWTIDESQDLMFEIYGGTGDCCPWDLDGGGNVGINDFLDLLSQWGTDPGGPPDFDGDGTVGINDFLELLANWGPCP